MIKRTLYFGNNAYLHTKEEQLVIDFADKTKPSAKVPIEDIGVVILDAYQLTISQNLISKLLDNNVAIISCDGKRMPQGLMLNLDGHSLQQERFRSQIESSLPLKKQLWQQTIKQKIKNQAHLLSHLTVVAASDLQNMEYWASAVKSGDPDNYEGRAAAFYWSRFFSNYVDAFKRGRFEDVPNNLLNYGYAILRAVTARSLVASGLLPTLGIHHHNKYNAYCLADDIMEPFRPYVDEIVKRQMKMADYHVITTERKAELLNVLSCDVQFEKVTRPLMVGLSITSSSLAKCFSGESKKLSFPTFR